MPASEGNCELLYVSVWPTDTSGTQLWLRALVTVGQLTVWQFHQSGPVLTATPGAMTIAWNRPMQLPWGVQHVSLSGVSLWWSPPLPQIQKKINDPGSHSLKE